MHFLSDWKKFCAFSLKRQFHISRGILYLVNSTCCQCMRIHTKSYIITIYFIYTYVGEIHGMYLVNMRSPSLHWRHNDHDGVSNHQLHGCLLNRLFRRRSKKTSNLRVTGLCVGNSPGPVNSPHKGPVTRKMFPFDDVIMFTEIVFMDSPDKTHIVHQNISNDSANAFRWNDALVYLSSNTMGTQQNIIKQNNIWAQIINRSRIFNVMLLKHLGAIVAVYDALVRDFTDSLDWV